MSDELTQRAEAAERRVAELTEQLRESERRAEQREQAAASRDKALQAQIRQLTALVKGMQKQLADALRAAHDPKKVTPADETAIIKPENLGPRGKSTESTKRPPPPKLDTPVDKKAPPTPKLTPRRPVDPAPHLPHDKTTNDVAACQRCASTDLAEVHRETSRKLRYVRAHLRVVEEERQTCRCRDCGAFTTPQMAPTAVPNGAMTASLLAHIVYSKCCMHLPLDRIAEDLGRLGVRFASGTMCDAMGHAASRFGPVRDAIVDDLFASGMLWFDGSGIKVLEPGEKGQHLGQLTVFSNDDAIAYHYTPTKHGDHFAKFLRVGEKNGFRGYLHADAASNANLLYADGAIIECGCWYHCRDKFVDARASSPDDAEIGIAWIAALFEVEHEADRAGDTPEARRDRRRRDSQPVLDGFLAWMASAEGQYAPEEELRKAVRYSRNHWMALTRFLEDGRIHLTNNRAERDLGPVGRGRKAWLHAGSDVGGERLAVLYTVVGSCLRIDVDPFAYMADVLPQLSTMPANRGRKIADLVPKAWKARKASVAP